jgi:hypothetical protein
MQITLAAGFDSNIAHWLGSSDSISASVWRRCRGSRWPEKARSDFVGGRFRAASEP